MQKKVFGFTALAVFININRLYSGGTTVDLETKIYFLFLGVSICFLFLGSVFLAKKKYPRQKLFRVFKIFALVSSLVFAIIGLLFKFELIVIDLFGLPASLFCFFYLAVCKYDEEIARQTK